MKIELSPWVISETSTSALVSGAANETPKKKRRRTQSQGSSNEDATTPSKSIDNDPQPTSATMVASFLPDTSSSSKWEPILTLTLAHQVTLLGTANTSNSSIHSSIDGVNLVDEKNSISTLQQYLTRSTAAASFLSSSKTNIPCLYDAKRQRLYACRDGNSRLISWRADATPDEADHEVHFSSPVVSLSVDVESDVIYGSAEDGALLVGRLATDLIKGNSSPWSLTSIQNKNRIPDGARHVATFCTYQKQKSQHNRKNRKQQPAHRRTAATASTSTYYQLYATSSHLLLHQHKIDAKHEHPNRHEDTLHHVLTASRSTLIPLHASAVSDVFWVGPCTIRCPPSHLEGNEKVDMPNEDDDIVALICYNQASDYESTDLVCAKVSLLQGRVIGTFRVPPSLIPPTPWQRMMGLVGDGTLLASIVAPTNSSSTSSSCHVRQACLCLYDVHRGGLLSLQPLEDGFFHSNNNDQKIVSLVTNGRKRLAIVAMVTKKKPIDSESFNHCCRVAMTSVKLQQQPKQEAMTLAQGLMLSKSSVPHVDATTIATGIGAGASAEPHSEKMHEKSESRHADLTIGRALQILQDARDEIQRISTKGVNTSETNTNSPSSLLSNAYLEAARLLASTFIARGGSTGTNSTGTSNKKYNPTDPDHANNPQEPSEKMNGCHIGKKRKASSSSIKVSSSSPASKQSIISSEPQPTLTAPLEPRLLPQSFVESAATIVVEILLLPDLAQENIRNEARALLRRLVRTGKVSARQALSIHKLSNVLRSLERTAVATTTTNGCLSVSGSNIAYSPVDFIFDLYRHCKDVSEHQMVTSLQYMVSRASSRDIYAQLSGRHRKKKSQLQRESNNLESLSIKMSLLDQWDRLQELCKHDGQSREQLEKDLAVVSCKLGLAGTTALIRKIALYSECNESLLKNAVNSVFKTPTELALLCRLFSDSLRTCSCGGGKASLLTDFAGARLRLMQWLTLLCEGLGERVSSQALLSQGHANDIAYAQESVAAEVKKTESMITLKVLVDSSVSWVHKETVLAAEASSKETTAKNDIPASSLPPYQIERLVF